MRKRILSLFLVAVMLVSMIAAYPMTVSAEGDTWDPDNGVYKISTTADMLAFDEAVDNADKYSFSDITVTLENDIVLPNTWEGIGNVDTKYFCGTFDGKGKTITMTGHTPSAEHGALFSQLGDGAVVENFKLVGQINVNADFIAGVANWAVGEVKIANIVCSVDFVSTNHASYMGTILYGINNQASSNITIDNCIYDGIIDLTLSSGTAKNIGGIMGRTFLKSYTTELTISNCVYAGDMTIDATAIDNIGMILGATEDYDVYTINIENCMVVGSMSFSDRCTSGFGGIGTVIGWTHANPNVIVKNIYYQNVKVPTTGEDLGITTSKGGGRYPDTVENVVAKTAEDMLNLSAETLGFSSNATYSFKENDGDIKYYPCPTGVAPTDGTWIKGLTVGLTLPDVIIDSYEDLEAFDTSVSLGVSYSGKLVVLENDITLPETFDGIGTPSKRFCGTFDGQGHTITASGHNLGDEFGCFFVAIDGATIRDVNFNGTAYMTGSYSAIVSCIARGDCLIENVRVSTYMQHANVKVEYSAGFVSLIPYDTAGDIVFNGCIFDGVMNIANGAQNNGGFMAYSGYLSEDNKVEKKITIKNSVYAGTMMFNDLDLSRFNGCFVGYANKTTDVNIEDCYSIGKMTFRSGTTDTNGNGVVLGQYNDGYKPLSIKNFYYIEFKNATEDGKVGLTHKGNDAANFGTVDSVYIKTEAEISELTADTFSEGFSYKENAVDLYMPCPTGLVPAEGWLDVLTVDYDGARVLGAQIRCTDAADQYSGIRFVTVFEKSAVENAGSADANFGVILISLAKYNALDDKTSVAALEAKGVKVAASKCDEDTDTYTVKAVVYNIDAANYRDDIVAVAYIGDTVIDSATRSIFTVAELCAADATASEAARDFSQKVIANVPAAN